MAAQVSGDTNYIASGLVEQIQADAIIAMNKAGVTSNLVRKVYEPRANQVTIQVWNAGANQLDSADVSSLTSGSERTAAIINSDKKTIALGMYSTGADLYDETIYSNVSDPTGPLGALLAQAIAGYWDKALNALFEGFSVSVGTSTVGLTVDNLSAAYASIMANRGMGQDVYAVLDPRQIWGSYGLFNDVVTSTQFGGSPALQSSALENAYFDKIAGIKIYGSPEFTESTNAVKGGVFTRNALGMGVSGPPAGFKVEHTRQGTYTRDCFTASTFFGVLELVDLWGVEVHTKVS